jgi:2-pyrone-4,6-dicarboxylate lactonase
MMSDRVAETPEAICIAPLALPSIPSQQLPQGATDCHCHVFENPQRYPFGKNRTYTPAPATLEQYRLMADRLGLQRMVQVSASIYGADNSLTLDAIAAAGQHRARGVAGVSPTVSDAELRSLHEGGIRGIRLSSHLKGYGGIAAMKALAPRVKALGWHLQLHVPQVDELATLEADLLRTPTSLVVYHMGMVRGTDGVRNAGFQALLRLLRARDNVWVKISAWYRGSSNGPADCLDMRPYVEELIGARPDRLLFGSNWPHPRLTAQRDMPDDGRLVDQLCSWIPDPDVLAAIMVRNPAILYGFEK